MSSNGNREANAGSRSDSHTAIGIKPGEERPADQRRVAGLDHVQDEYLVAADLGHPVDADLAGPSPTSTVRARYGTSRTRC